MKHIKSRVAALLLALAMVLSLAPMAFAADEFPDMPAEEEASYAAVKSAVDNKIMTGENGMLNLEGTILRSTVSKMVVTAFAAKGEADLSGYPDVEDGKWYVEWMAKAAQMGIMSGSYGKMNPDSEVTLQEVATMLVRALGLPTDNTAKLDGVADWAAPYVKALIDAGYISAEAAADAGKPMTRAAFAEVIYKVSGEGNYVKEAGDITKDVNGNIVITADGVSLKGITVTGDVIIADGVDAGSIVLDGVKIEGRLVVRGGAEAELKNGATASATVVAKTSGEVTVKADAYSDAGAITVSGTNSQVADKVTVDMPEPNVTVTEATEVAVQNAKGGSVTLQANGASLSVESGTVANVTVADGADDVKVDVAEGATIENVTTNEDITVTGEGTVAEVTGSGVVSDEAGEVIGGGDDEPAEVPSVNTPAPATEPDPNAPTNATHTHVFDVDDEDDPATIASFDATRHTITCTVTVGEGTCGAVIYAPHDYDENGVCKATGCGVKKAGTVTDEGEVTDPETKPAGWAACTNEDPDDTSDPHTWVLKTTTPGEDCESEGSKTYECSVCKSTRTDATAATGHSYKATTTVAATCNKPGSISYKCTVCNDEPEPTVVPATGKHSWKLESTDPATCTANGTAHYGCTTCTVDAEATPALTKATQDVTITATGHNYRTAWDSDETNHWHECATCGDKTGSKAAHDYGEDEDNTVCTVCGYDKADGDEEGDEPVTHTHTWTKADATGKCDNHDGLAGADGCNQMHDCSNTKVEKEAAVTGNCTVKSKTAKTECSVCGKIEGGQEGSFVHGANYDPDTGKCDLCKD